MFPKFLEDSCRVACQKHISDVQRNSFVEDDNSMFLSMILNLKSRMQIEKCQYIDFQNHPEYFDYLESLQNDKILEILDKCLKPERKSLLPYLLKYLRYTEFLKKSGLTKNTPAHSQNTPTSAPLDFKTSMVAKNAHPRIIDTEKLNQENQFFSKMSKAKIINLENVAHEVCLNYLENLSSMPKIDSILIPSNEDLIYFNSIYQTEADDPKSPEHPMKNKSKNQPKVLTMNFNLESYGKHTSFVNLQKMSSEYVEAKPQYLSLYIHTATEHKTPTNISSARLNNNNSHEGTDGTKNSIEHIHMEEDIKKNSDFKKDSEHKSKLNLRLINTDSSMGSPNSSGNRFVNKIHNFYIYYHTVKRNVNPNSHRRQYSKSIQ